MRNLLDVRPETAGRSFRLKYDDRETKTEWYLGAFRDTAKDRRDVSTYVSVSSDKRHRNFLWTIDSKNVIRAADGAKLSSHRCYGKDSLGSWGIFVMIHPGAGTE